MTSTARGNDAAPDENGRSAKAPPTIRPRLSWCSADTRSSSRHPFVARLLRSRQTHPGDEHTFDSIGWPRRTDGLYYCCVRRDSATEPCSSSAALPSDAYASSIAAACPKRMARNRGSCDVRDRFWPRRVQQASEAGRALGAIEDEEQFASIVSASFLLEAHPHGFVRRRRLRLECSEHALLTPILGPCARRN